MLYSFRAYSFRGWSFWSIFGIYPMSFYFADYCYGFEVGPEYCDGVPPMQFCSAFQTGAEHSEGVLT